ncbi:hypothetical protein C8R44DRAFT_869344 [Mycena epipterygia]|nr:hypothetical protein C8R44DRAFT_869344 [Mycena epipterygia]
MAEARLPWKKMTSILAEQGLEVSGWPDGIPKPRSDGKTDKGISGFNTDHIAALHKAMKAGRIDFKPLAPREASRRAPFAFALQNYHRFQIWDGKVLDEANAVFVGVSTRVCMFRENLMTPDLTTIDAGTMREAAEITRTDGFDPASGYRCLPSPAPCATAVATKAKATRATMAAKSSAAAAFRLSDDVAGNAEAEAEAHTVFVGLALLSFGVPFLNGARSARHSMLRTPLIPCYSEFVSPFPAYACEASSSTPREASHFSFPPPLFSSSFSLSPHHRRRDLDGELGAMREAEIAKTDESDSQMDAASANGDIAASRCLPALPSHLRHVASHVLPPLFLSRRFPSSQSRRRPPRSSTSDVCSAAHRTLEHHATSFRVPHPPSRAHAVSLLNLRIPSLSPLSTPHRHCFTTHLTSLVHVLHLIPSWPTSFSPSHITYPSFTLPPASPLPLLVFASCHPCRVHVASWGSGIKCHIIGPPRSRLSPSPSDSDSSRFSLQGLPL